MVCNINRLKLILCTTINLLLIKKSDVLVTDGTFSIMSVLQTQMPGGALTENWKQNTSLLICSTDDNFVKPRCIIQLFIIWPAKSCNSEFSFSTEAGGERPFAGGNNLGLQSSS